jgi:hypothetical protein
MMRARIHPADGLQRGCLLLSLVWLAGCGTERPGVTPEKTSAPPPQAAPQPTPAPAPPPARVNHWTSDWTPLFDGKTLTNWAVTDFVAHGPVTVQEGEIKIEMSDELSGITWTNGTLPKSEYEISLDAVKLAGNDFFCGLTFPVADSSCSLILGGWGGGMVGLSSLDDQDASENETSHSMYFETGHWYHVQVRVTAAKIEAWLDGKKIIDASIAGRKVSLRPGSIYLSAPLGVATYETRAGVKNIQLRLIAP